MKFQGKNLWKIKYQFTDNSPISFRDLKYNNRYSKLLFLQRFIEKYVIKLRKAAPRFELGIKDLQSSALPLGHAAGKNLSIPLQHFNSRETNSLLIISNGHGEDIIACEIIKEILLLKKFNNIEVMPLVGDGKILIVLHRQKSLKLVSRRYCPVVALVIKVSEHFWMI